MSIRRKILVCFFIFILMTSTVFASSTYSIENLNMNEIEDITNAFFRDKEQAFLSNNQFDVRKYCSSDCTQNAFAENSSKLFELEKKIRDDNALEISNEKFEHTINSIKIDGNKATVNCFEHYEYTYDNDPIKSSRGIEYQITFIKNNNKWEIDNIVTNNELEKLFSQTDELSQEYNLNTAKDIKIDEKEESNFERSSGAKGVTHAYNRTLAADYALEYSDSTHNSTATSAYNSKFPNFAPNDCQNFVSQCVWAGLGGENTTAAISNKHKPMITTSGRKWFCSSASSYASSWTVVGDFRDYVAKEADGLEGIYGVRYIKGNAEKAQKGDVIQICNSSGTWYHSYIINKVTGTYGSRTISDLYVCAHTSNRRNENLANVIGSNSTNFRLVRINGIRY